MKLWQWVVRHLGWKRTRRVPRAAPIKVSMDDLAHRQDVVEQRLYYLEEVLAVYRQRACSRKG